MLREDQSAIADQRVQVLGLRELSVLRRVLVELPRSLGIHPRILQSILQLRLRQGPVERPSIIHFVTQIIPGWVGHGICGPQLCFSMSHAGLSFLSPLQLSVQLIVQNTGKVRLTMNPEELLPRVVHGTLEPFAKACQR